MPTKLPVKLENDPQKRLWEKHQSIEQKSVNSYKEGLCYNCFKNKAVSATLADICQECFDKRGTETILAMVVEKFYGMCFFCGKYKFPIVQYNFRLCMHCHEGVRKILTAYNKAGGFYGHDPFWKSMKKKQGKTWARQLRQGTL